MHVVLWLPCGAAVPSVSLPFSLPSLEHTVVRGIPFSKIERTALIVYKMRFLESIAGHISLPEWQCCPNVFPIRHFDILYQVLMWLLLSGGQSKCAITSLPVLNWLVLSLEVTGLYLCIKH